MVHSFFLSKMSDSSTKESRVGAALAKFDSSDSNEKF